MTTSALFRVRCEMIPPAQEFLNLMREGVTIQALRIDGDYLYVRAVGEGELYVKAVSLLKALEKNKIYIPSARNKDSKYIGVPGEQMTAIADFYDVGIKMHPVYGLQFIYRIMIRGNEVTWTTAVRMAPGKRKISFRIKAHQTFNGVKQTAISHARIKSKRRYERMDKQ